MLWKKGGQSWGDSRHVDIETLPYIVHMLMRVDMKRLVQRTVASISCAGAGATALTFRLAMKLMDYNLMATITALLAPVLPDFKKAKNCGKLS